MIITFLLMILVTLIPLGVLMFLISQKSTLQSNFLNTNAAFKALNLRFGSLFANLWLPSTPCLFYNFIFLARRYVYALSIGVLGVQPPIQHMIQMLMSVAMTVYIIKYRPSTVLVDNYVELYNELTILAVFTLITPYVHDQGFSVENKYDHGFMVASVVFLNVLVNFALFARNTY